MAVIAVADGIGRLFHTVAVFGFFLVLLVALCVLAIVVWMVAHSKAKDEQAESMRDEPDGRRHGGDRDGF